MSVVGAKRSFGGIDKGRDLAGVVVTLSTLGLLAEALGAATGIQAASRWSRAFHPIVALH
jgi:hypothetical protein